MILETAGLNEATFVFNVLQKYLYELSAYYRDELDADGNIAYPWFDTYFDPEEHPERRAILIREGASTVGFILINAYSDLDEPIDHAVAEFTIFPAFRGRGLGKQAAALLFQDNPGTWELTFNNTNETAASFWTSVTRPYRPDPTPINARETILSFEVPA
ncbi:MAG: hypothetical protein IJH87_01615 [Atopobiaceae bacterium]|nr:hypothetical protein [Atopobiaceae bacterium]